MIRAFFAVLLLASGVMAQSTAPDAAELTKLLTEFLAGASRNDPAAHERFWADDLIYTRSAGRRTTKAEIMHDVRSAPAPKPDDPKIVYTAEDIRIQQYGNNAIVAFRLVATTEVDGAKQVQNLLNSGTFLKRNGKWQVVNWQSTRMARTVEDDTREVTAALAAFGRAVKDRDAKQLTAITDPSFVWMQAGRRVLQTEVLDYLKSTRVPARPYTVTETISVYGDMAVVRGDEYSMTLANEGGVWKLVSLSTSPRCDKLIY